MPLRLLLCAAALLVSSLGCSVAFAADAAGAIDLPWWAKLLIAVAAPLGTALLGLLARWANKATQELAERWNLAFLARVDEMAFAVVTDLYATEVKHAKEATQDGKLTDAEKKRFKAIAMERLKAHFSYEALGKLFGGSVETGVGSTVEKAVKRSKDQGKAARSPR